MENKTTKPVVHNAQRVALYARVSTLDKGQDPETQLVQLREYAARRGCEIAGEFIDHASGTSQQRMQYKQMIQALKKGKQRWYLYVLRPLCPFNATAGERTERVPDIRG